MPCPRARAAWTVGSQSILHCHPLGIVPGLQLGLPFADSTTGSISFFSMLQITHGRRTNPSPSISPSLSSFCSAPSVPFPFLCHPCSISPSKGTPEVPLPQPTPPPSQLSPLLSPGAPPGVLSVPWRKVLMASAPEQCARLWEHQVYLQGRPCWHSPGAVHGVGSA